MATRVSSLDNLQDSDTKSKEVGAAYLLRTIAGRLRVAYELATGRQTTSGEPYTIGLNPSGDRGVNGSGPPWGVAFQCPHGGKSGGKRDTTSWLGQKNVFGTVFGDGDRTGWELPIRLWVQGYERAVISNGSKAPLARLYPVVRMHTASAGNVDVTVTARAAGYGPGRSKTFTVSGTNPTQVFSDADLYFETDSAAITSARLTFSAALGNGIYVTSVAYNQIVVRGHTD